VSAEDQGHQLRQAARRGASRRHAPTPRSTVKPPVDGGEKQRKPTASSRPASSDAASSPSPSPSPASKVRGPVGKRTDQLGIGKQAGASKSTKLKTVVKSTAEGATGKSTAGKIGGGGLTGAVVGAAHGLAQVTSKKHLFIIVAIIIGLPFFVEAGFITAEVVVVSSVVSDNSSQADHAAATTSIAVDASPTTSRSESAILAAQQGTDGTIIPWEVVAAVGYYESGHGASVAQESGTCPTKPAIGGSTTRICPAVVSATSKVVTATYSSPGAPITSAGSGFTSKVGRNGSVPAHLAPTSPDWRTTNTADWDCIRDAESGDHYTDKSGAYGFLSSTWSSLGQTGNPGTAPPALQNQLALEILNHEGHFSGAWNDACTGSGGESENPVSAIRPGVPVPQTPGTATSLGSTPLTVAEHKPATPKSPSSPATPTTTTTTTPPAPPVVSGHSSGKTGTTTCLNAGGAGPYCITTQPATTSGSPRPLTAKERSTHAAAAAWVAEQLQASARDAKGGSDVELMDMTAGITKPVIGVPTLSSGSQLGAQDKSLLLAALAKLPIAANSTSLDQNVYDLAADWSVGYEPQATKTATSCVTSTVPAPVTIESTANPAKPTSVSLTTAQVTVAYQIVTVAGTAHATNAEEVALVAGALSWSNLGATSSAKGTFGTGATSVTTAVPALLAKISKPTRPPATLATAMMGSTASAYDGWLSGAIKLVDMATGVCDVTLPGNSPSIAVEAAEAELGLPYVWGGGGDTGPSLGLSGTGAPACHYGKIVAGAEGAGNKCVPPYTRQTGHPGFDCSGLVQYAFHVAGIQLPRTSEAQYAQLTSARGAKVVRTPTPAKFQVGDLVFYSFTPGTVDHVTIYAGSGELVQAPETGEDVQLIPFYKGGFVAAVPA